MGKDNRKLQEDYNAIRDSWKIRLRVENMMDKTNLGKGNTVKLNLELPEELMTFAAWLAMRAKRYENGNNSKIDVSDIIENPLNTEDYKAASSLICDIVFKTLMEREYEAICQNAHPYLYENPDTRPLEEDPF